jgi:hypothetical protein
VQILLPWKINITYSECVPVALVIQPMTLLCVVCLVLPYLSILYHKRHDFWGEINFEHVFRFFLQIMYETSVFLNIIQRDINIHTSLCKVLVPLIRF